MLNRGRRRARSTRAYAVLYAVAQPRGEIAIRMALGAQHEVRSSFVRHDVLAWVAS
jgi:hypothetical protein